MSCPGENRQSPPERSFRFLLCVICAGLLIGLLAAVALITRQVHHGRWTGPTWLAAALTLAAAGVYFVSIPVCPRARKSRVVLFVLLAGAAMRAPMWWVPPAKGADYWRYLWDGAVTAQGMNPFRYSPAEVLQPEMAQKPIGRLAAENRHIVQHVTHPNLRTIYPPGAQSLFAVAHWLAPFELLGLRIVWLACELAGAAILLSLMGHLKLPAACFIVAFWNPLLITETYVGGHVDVAVAAAILWLTWCLVRGRPVMAAVAMAAAAALKLYPLLLVCFVLRACRPSRPKAAAVLGVTVGVLGLMAIPYLLAGQVGESGLLTYTRAWQANAGAYRLVHGLVGRFLPGPQAGVAARLTVGGLLLAAAVWLGCRSHGSERALCSDVATVVLLMLLLAPTVYPWYYVALVPLAAVRPRVSLLAGTALLALTYLPQAGQVWLAWLVHLPIWMLLAAEGLSRRFRGRALVGW